MKWCPNSAPGDNPTGDQVMMTDWTLWTLPRLKIAYLEHDADSDLHRIAELDRLLSQARAQVQIERQIAERACEVRDALARRCAEQARHIADLLAMAEEDKAPDPDPIHAAIAVHQRQGVR